MKQLSRITCEFLYQSFIQSSCVRHQLKCLESSFIWGLFCRELFQITDLFISDIIIKKSWQSKMCRLGCSLGTESIECWHSEPKVLSSISSKNTIFSMSSKNYNSNEQIVLTQKQKPIYYVSTVSNISCNILYNIEYVMWKQDNLLGRSSQWFAGLCNILGGGYIDHNLIELIEILRLDRTRLTYWNETILLRHILV